MTKKSERPAISVIVPIYNAEKYLVKAVDSVLAQSVSDWELLLIDDCSTDGSGAICRSLAESDPRIIHITLPENGGISVARNAGLDRARGRYVVFLDADDEYFPDAFRVFMTLADKYPRAGMICGEIVRGHDFSDIMLPQERKEAKTIIDEAELTSGLEALESMLYQRGKPDHSASAKLFKASLFNTVRFTPGVYFEDMEIFPRLLRETRQVILSREPVYFYRQNPSSFLNSPSPSRLDAMKITDAILDDVRRYEPEHVAGARNLRLSAHFTSFFIASILGDRENADKAWRVIRDERREALSDKNVRLKNKAGVLLSYLGRPLMTAIGTKRKKYH